MIAFQTKHCLIKTTRDLDNNGKADLYEINFEKYCSAGRDPHPRNSAEEGFKLNERRWTWEEDRVKEWQEVIEQEDRRKTLGKQNTVAVENLSLEGTKSKATTNRTGSLGSSSGSKQSLKVKKKERYYETDISEDDDDEKGKHDPGEDSGSQVSPPNAASAQENTLTSGSRSSLLSASMSPKQGKAVKSGSRPSLKALLGVKSLEEKEKQKVDKQNKSTWSKRDKIIYFEDKADPKK